MKLNYPIYAIPSMLLATLVVALSGCTSLNREMTREKLIAEQPELKRELLAREAYRDESNDIGLSRKIREAEEAGHPGEFSFDVLVLSGGGQYGAFGTGVLSGWGKIDDPALTRPDFDVVTGISTGALIAPFALVGTEDDIETVKKLYAEIEPDIVDLRGLLFFLPKKPALYTNEPLIEMIGSNVTPDLIEDLEVAFSNHRQLMIASTDLDVGALRSWNIGYEFLQLSTVEEKQERLTTILLASSAIPAVFPPIEIDGHLHVDGGASQMLFMDTDIDESTDYLHARLDKHSHLSRVTIRVWVIVNGKLLVEPEVVKPTWTSIASRSIATLVQTSTLNQLKQFRLMVKLLEDEFPHVDGEFRYLAIPQDMEIPKSDSMFDPALIERLIEVGKEVGQDPNSWQDEVPDTLLYERE